MALCLPKILCFAGALVALSACGQSDRKYSTPPAAEDAGKDRGGNKPGRGDDGASNSNKGGNTSLPSPKETIAIEGRKTSDNGYEYIVDRSKPGEDRQPLSLVKESAVVKLKEAEEDFEEKIPAGSGIPSKITLSKQPIDNKVKSVKFDGMNGIPGTDWLYDKTKNVVTIYGTLPVSKELTITYKILNGPELEYEVKGKDSRVIAVFDADSGDQIKADVDDDDSDFEIGVDDWELGRELRAEYFNSKDAKKEFNLPVVPIPGSISTNVPKCMEGEGIVVKDKKVTATCGYTEAAELILKYEYKQEGALLFTYKDSVDPEKGKWIVKIDGTETTNYVRSGLDFVINTDLADGTVVTISYIQP